MTINWNSIKDCFFYTETYIVRSSSTGNFWYAELKTDGKNIRLGQKGTKEGAKQLCEKHASRKEA